MNPFPRRETVTVWGPWVLMDHPAMRAASSLAPNNIPMVWQLTDRWQLGNPGRGENEGYPYYLQARSVDRIPFF